MKQKELQKNLYIEYALGKKPWKKYPHLMQMGEEVIAIAPYLQIVFDDVFTGSEQVGFDVDKVKQTKIDVPLVQYLMSSDNGFVKYLVNLKYYLENPKNYIFSPYLTSLLQGTSGDIDCRYLHKETSGYIEMPGLVDKDGDKVLGILFHIEKRDVWLLRISWILEHPIAGVIQSYFFEKIESGSLMEIASKTTREETKVRENNGKIELYLDTECDYAFGNLELTTINAILWILHKDDMVEKLNEFAQKKSKREVQEKIYTQKSFYECDIERSFTVDSSFTKGHMRWQPYGQRIEQSDGSFKSEHIKLIYIQPYTRDLKKYDKEEK